MPLMFLWPFIKGFGGIVSSILSTPLGRALALAAGAFLVGDWYGTHSTRLAVELAAHEARIAAQARDIRSAKNVADLAKTQADAAAKAQADTLATLEEIRAHAKDRNCLLSPADADRLRRIR